MFIARDRLKSFRLSEVATPLPRGDVLPSNARRYKHSAPPERASVFSHVLVVSRAGLEPATHTLSFAKALALAADGCLSCVLTSKFLSILFPLSFLTLHELNELRRRS